MRARWIVLAALLVAAAWFLVRSRSSTAVDGTAVEPTAPGRGDGATASALEIAPVAERVAEGAPTAGVRPMPAIDVEDLLARLRAIARAFDAGDAKRLQTEVEFVVTEPARVLWVLDWLATPVAPRDGLAALGATLSLEAALAVYDRAGATFTLSGEELVLHALELLPRIDAGLRKRVIALLAAARNDRGWVLDTRFLPRVVELRRAHPDQASEYAVLLARIAESLGEDERRESFQRLFLQGEEDPLLVKVALCSLLESAPEVFLPLAEDLYVRHPRDDRLRAAIAQAIATAAPVDLAASVLGRIGESTQYDAFATLGSRAGSHDAIAREYDALLASGGNATGRKMLVSALRGESTDVLLGIGRLDPDRGVRLQAFLTLSIDGPVDRSVVDELRTLRTGDAGLGSRNVSSIAENVLLHSTGAARDAARDLLSEIVRDATLSDKDRLDAYSRVRKWVPEDAFFGVVIGGKPLK